MAIKKITLNELKSLVKKVVTEQENEFATAWQEKNQNKNSMMDQADDDVRYDLSPKERRVYFVKRMSQLLSNMNIANTEESLEWAGELVSGYDKYLMRLKNAADHGINWENDK